jgi:glycosyltransferase involved in cell wall biosynthesis
MPGFVENYYCENCLRDNQLVKSLRSIGHDVFIMPMYIPLDKSIDIKGKTSGIYFGGVSAFLRLKIPLLKRMPRFIERVFDNASLLRWAAKQEGATTASDLSKLSLSIFNAADSVQSKELHRLIHFLKHKEKPDLIILSLVLFSELAKKIKAHINVPLVCFLQDEDTFIDTFAKPYINQSWDAIGRGVKHIDAFFTGSHYFKSHMAKQLSVPIDNITVVNQGIDLTQYVPHNAPLKIPTIGYLSQVTHAKGLDTLLDAFFKLKKIDALSHIQLRIAGNKIYTDKQYVKMIKDKINQSMYKDDIHFDDAFDLRTRKHFFEQVSILSVPEVNEVSYGLYVLEALASGIPVVQPKNGVFPEMLDTTGGGVLVAPNNVNALVDGLKTLLLNPNDAHALGQKGRTGVEASYDINHTINTLSNAFENLVSLKGH